MKIYNDKDVKERYFVNIETGELIRDFFVENNKARVDENNDLIGVDYSFKNLRELSYDEYILFQRVCSWYYNSCS